MFTLSLTTTPLSITSIFIFISGKLRNDNTLPGTLEPHPRIQEQRGAEVLPAPLEMPRSEVHVERGVAEREGADGCDGGEVWAGGGAEGCGCGVWI